MNADKLADAMFEPQALLGAINDAANDARHQGFYARANALIQARVMLHKHLAEYDAQPAIKCACCGDTGRAPTGQGVTVECPHCRTQPAQAAQPVATIESTQDRHGPYLTHANVVLRVWNGYAPKAGDEIYLAAQPVGVPDGWVMVPREPTFDMVAAIGSVMIRRYPRENFYGHAVLHEAATAMLAAAPRPPSSISGLSESGLVRVVGDVDKGVSVSASGTQEEASGRIDVGIDRAEHDLKSAVLAGPHGGKFTPYEPEGWVLVPREPTQQMLAAEDDSVPPKEDWGEGGDPFAWGRISWATMLAAAPQPPARPSADAEDAARYRYLRQPQHAIVYALVPSAWGYENSPAGHVRYDTPEQLDSAIDAARAAEGDGK